MVYKNVSEKLLSKYAKLVVTMGTNLKKDQPLVISASLNAAKFARLCAEEAYNMGAKYVYTLWYDDEMNKINYQHADVAQFESIPDYRISQYDYYIEEKVARLSIVDDTPGFFGDVDPNKLKAATQAAGKAFKRYRDYSMGNHGQWSIAAIPSLGWAKLVFPQASDQEAIDKLWDAIFKAVKVSEDNDPIAAWKEHNETLKIHNEKLNDFNFKALHFKNDKGTDLVVGLADDHRWAGGAEIATNGQVFNPNIPSEETFTMPHRDNVNGVVYSTKPLDYQGVLIDEFKLVFKNGEVIKASARENEEKLLELLAIDEGSKYIGEVALISHDSPISNSNILFYNTLFDENASCHLALGAAYPMNVVGGTKMSEEELKTKGFNSSMIHVDFMFGSHDMNIEGIKADGSKIKIFEDGNFII